MIKQLLEDDQGSSSIMDTISKNKTLAP